jgi:hypothetical protein
LRGLESCGLDSTEQYNLNYWKTVYETDLVFDEIGISALDTLISVDTSSYEVPASLVVNNYYFGCQINSITDIIYPNCDYYTPNKMLVENVNTEFLIYPNPADNILKVQLNHILDKNHFSVLSFNTSDGKLIFTTTYSETENALKTINVSTWKPGVYFYKYTYENEIYQGKIVIK